MSRHQRSLPSSALPSRTVLLAAVTLAAVTIAGACGSDATLYVDDAGALIDAFRSDVASGSDGSSRGDTDTRSDTGRDSGDRDAGGRDTGPTDVASDSGDRFDVGSGDTNTGLAPACVDVAATLDFGVRIAAQAHELVLWIENCGDLDTDDVRVSALAFVNEGGITSAPEFYFADPPELPLVVAPFDRYPLQVRYRSDGPGAHTAVIRMTTNDPTKSTIDVAVSAEVR